LKQLDTGKNNAQSRGNNPSLGITGEGFGLGWLDGFTGELDSASVVVGGALRLRQRRLPRQRRQSHHAKAKDHQTSADIDPAQHPGCYLRAQEADSSTEQQPPEGRAQKDPQYQEQGFAVATLVFCDSEASEDRDKGNDRRRVSDREKKSRKGRRGVQVRRLPRGAGGNAVPSCVGWSIGALAPCAPPFPFLCRRRGGRSVPGEPLLRASDSPGHDSLVRRYFFCV